MNLFTPEGRLLHHVAIAVPSLEEAILLHERLSGNRCSPPETVSAQGVRVSFCGQVELIEPLGPDTTVARFLERRGPGLHHIAYRSKDLAQDLRFLADTGIELIDAEPRPGATGHLVAFLHPRSTGGVLIELIQHSD
ncbi:MAG: methylmalonyl-CoA epimerase [Gemmatimonadota bacterium]|jgi:methylmalonyl-CoA epimerase